MGLKSEHADIRSQPLYVRIYSQVLLVFIGVALQQSSHIRKRDPPKNAFLPTTLYLCEICKYISMYLESYTQYKAIHYAAIQH